MNTNTSPRLRINTNAGQIWIGLSYSTPTCVRASSCLAWPTTLAEMNRRLKLFAEDGPMQIVIERSGIRSRIDIESGVTFEEFVQVCRQEISLDDPCFDNAEEESLVREAIAKIADIIR